MTSDAQSALRRVMEAYSRVTRFCLICNYVTRVIEPLASRCAKFRFRPLPKASMVDRIQYIARMENVSLGEGALDTILHASGGDMRKAVTFFANFTPTSGGLRKRAPTGHLCHGGRHIRAGARGCDAEAMDGYGRF